MDVNQKFTYLAVINQCFSPGTPIGQRDLFAGRLAQIGQGIDAVSQRGTHAIIFGERGVGKTSLANCLVDFIPNPTGATNAVPIYIAVRVNCTSISTYESIWREIFGKIALSRRATEAGFRGGLIDQQVSAAEA